MQKDFLKFLSVIVFLSLLFGFASGRIKQVQAISTSMVISQVYGGGGNSGSIYKNDYIEIFNRGSAPVSLAGWSVQYASATGTSWSKTELSGTIQAGGYYLIQEYAGSGGTQSLPTPDATGTINVAAASGKIALVSSTTLLSGACPAGVIDLVGFGTANCYEAGAVSALTNATAAKRNTNGCTETDVNSADFTNADPTVSPTPRNSGSSFATCSGPGDTAPEVSNVLPGDHAVDVAVDANVMVTFSESVSLGDVWFGLSCSTSGSRTAVVSGGPAAYIIDPESDLGGGETCTLTVFADKVSDLDVNDPPDTMTGNYVSTFTVVDSAAACGTSFIPIYNIQGSGDTAAITGIVTTEGLVISDDEGASPALKGFYLQDVSGDGDISTSDGLFVFNGENNNVANGDLVRVSGTAAEYQGETQVNSVTSIIKCGTGILAPINISLPFASLADRERYEGMLVRFPQTLSVTEHYLLGRFGEVVLSGSGRLYQSTAIASPGGPALTVQSTNELDQIILDDGLNNQNPDPILFGRGGDPLSMGNTLRAGDTITNLVGVLSYGWGGNGASPNAYRIRPVHALGGGIPDFVAANPRPNSPPSVGGSIKAVGMNLLNYFNTFGAGACANGVGGPATDCRGADDADEFLRQSEKTVNAILGMDADVIGIIEIENDGYGSASAIQDLVNELNAAAGAGTYTFINVDARTTKTNALGNDAIKSGIIYQPAQVDPVGTTAVLDTLAFVNGGDSAGRNRVSLAQAFQTTGGERFIFNVNHLKSKGSACDTPDAGDGQGNCNGVRTQAVNELVKWLGTDPTGTGDPDILAVGDLNSYAKEDPIAAFESAGYVNMISHFNGDESYSYVYDGQWGYLDHAIASPGLLAQATGAADWHINADEPAVLDYNTDYKSAGQINSLYGDEPFRMSDHDPVVVGLGLDSFAPETRLGSHPNDPSNRDAAEFTFSSADAKSIFECRLDDASFAVCSSPVNIAGLKNGSHVFQVRAIDTVGNVEALPASFSWIVDGVAPMVFSITRARPSPTNLATVTFMVTFSEDVKGVDQNDFSLIVTDTLMNASISKVTGSGASRKVDVVFGPGSGTLHLNLIDNDSIQDGLFTSLVGVDSLNGDFTSGETYMIDRKPPTVISIVRTDADNTNAYGVNYLVTFSESVFGVDLQDFGLIAPDLPGSQISRVSGTGATRTVTVLTGTGTGTIQLNLTDNDTVKDLVQNRLGGTGLGNITSGEIYTVVRIPPAVVSIERGGTDPAVSSSIKFTVRFSEPVTGVDKTDFSPEFTGIASALVSSVKGTGTTYTVTVIVGLGTGELGLNLTDNDSIKNALLAQLGGFGPGNGSFNAGERYSVNKVYPTVVSILRVHKEFFRGTSLKFIVNFSEPVTGVDATDFSLDITGTIPDASITGVVGGGAVWIIIIHMIANPTDTDFGTLRLDLLDDDSIKDASLTPLGGAGSGNGNFISSATYIVNRISPTMLSIVKDSADPVGTFSVNHIVTFSKIVTGVDKADFELETTGLSESKISMVSGTGAIRTATVLAGTGVGELQLKFIDNRTVRDLVSNNLGAPGQGKVITASSCQLMCRHGTVG